MSKTTYKNLYPKPLQAEDFLKEETYKHTRAPVEHALTIIPEAYTSDEFYNLEQKQVFQNSWVPCAVLPEVKKPGDVKVVEIGGESIIITRNKEGELRAFYNVCRHRGVQILDKGCTAVKSARIRCPYHSWAYDLNGKCLGTPLFEGSDIPADMQGMFDMGGVEAFTKDDYPLFDLHVDSWGMLIFIHMGENPAPLNDQLGDLVERFAPYNLHEWEIAAQKQFVFKANYKLVGENFMEYYHLPWIHPELLKVSRMEDHYRYQGNGMYTGMMTWPISAGEDGGWLGLPPFSGLKAEQTESAKFIWLFPNVAVNVMPNHSFIMITKPNGARLTIEDTYIMSHPESLAAEGAEHEVEQLVKFWTMVNEQDIDIVEKMHTGIGSRAYKGGRMCYHFEEPVHRYMNMIIDKMVGLERIPQGDDVPDDKVSMFGSKDKSFEPPVG
ncbi:MAG: choline monooxygenase [Cellvibrionaceae bacterium]|jgi:choline monooxygenase